METHLKQISAILFNPVQKIRQRRVYNIIKESDRALLLFTPISKKYITRGIT